MYFSVTERQTAKRCPRAHRLSSKGGQHLGLLVPPVYLSCGTLIHKGSQLWFANPDTSYEAHVMTAGMKLIEKTAAKYFLQVGAHMSTEEEAPLYEAISYAQVMARNYQLQWKTPLPEGFTLIRTEQRVVVPVPGTEHECHQEPGGCEWYTYGQDCQRCGNSGITYHYLDGRFDGLIQDRAGRIHILEHKTYDARPSEQSLKTADQFLAYMWLAIQLGIGDVAGLDYDGLWRRDKVPKNRTFEDLFMRLTITRTRAELEEFQRFLPNELNMMAHQLSLEEDPYINRAWQGCYDCSFATKKLPSGSYRPGLCDAMSRGENVSVIRNAYYTVRDDDDEETDDDAAA